MYSCPGGGWPRSSGRQNKVVLPRVSLGEAVGGQGVSVMSAHIWRDGRLFGFNGVEWLTWLIAVAVIGVFALAVTI